MWLYGDESATPTVSSVFLNTLLFVHYNKWPPLVNNFLFEYVTPYVPKAKKLSFIFSHKSVICCIFRRLNFVAFKYRTHKTRTLVQTEVLWINKLKLHMLAVPVGKCTLHREINIVVAQHCCRRLIVIITIILLELYTPPSCSFFCLMSSLSPQLPIISLQHGFVDIVNAGAPRLFFPTGCHLVSSIPFTWPYYCNVLVSRALIMGDLTCTFVRCRLCFRV